MDPLMEMLPAPEDSPEAFALPRPANSNLFAVEGELVGHEVSGAYYVLRVDDTDLTELLTWHFKVLRGDRDKRSFGRVRITVEMMHE